MATLHQPRSLAAGSGHATAETGPVEAFRHGFRVGLVVVHDQHFGGGPRRVWKGSGSQGWRLRDA